jgi:hypothetical protein
MALAFAEREQHVKAGQRQREKTLDGRSLWFLPY